MTKTYPSCFMSYEKLHELLHEGATVITPNNRLSDALIKSFVDTNEQTPKPACMSYPAFLMQSFKTLRHETPEIEHPILLTSPQLQMLWQTAVFEKGTPQTLIRKVIEAWGICENWQIEFPHPAFHATDETTQFQTWCITLKKALQANAAITEQELPLYLIRTLKSATTKHIVWVAFDNFTPLQLALQKHLRSLGVQQTVAEISQRNAQRFQYIASDALDEYAVLIEWTKTKLNAGAKRVAIIVPDLQGEASRIKRQLAYHFDDNAFNLSLGKPLASFPLIAHALKWLQLDTFEIDHHTILLLLNSPYLAGGSEEFYARANLLNTAPILEERKLPFYAFKSAIKTKLPSLFERLDTLKAYPKSQSPKDWAINFTERLNHLGFPGEHHLTSVQYQCFERLKLLLEEFMTIAAITPTLSKKEALTAIQTLANTSVFQPEKKDTPIQVLGVLEASGALFDAIWMCHATDQNLPEKTALNAFIPIQLQQDMQMPYVDAKLEDALAKKRLSRFYQSTNTFVISYAKIIDDMSTLPSPLLEDLPHITVSKQGTGNTKLVSEPEHYTLPLTDKDNLTGPSSRLTNQALCPFRAFAEHRLHATSPITLTDGLSLSLRGQLLHEILERVWQNFKTQRALKACTEESLNQYITDAIDNTLKPLYKLKPTSFSELTASIEYERLKQLVLTTLNWDKARPEFEIESLEECFTLHLGKLTFKLRIDRLDKIKDNAHWLIDYKSSIPSPLPFEETRPETPQLLLYALLDETIEGLLFVAPKGGDLGARGVAKDNLEQKGVRTIDWSEARQTWHENLSALADEFYDGRCEPQPQKASACTTCAFPLLCRIHSLP